MLPEENTGTVTGAGNTPVGEPGQNPTPTTPTPAPAPAAAAGEQTIPVSQYQGLQRNYIKMQAELKDTQARLVEATAFGGTLQEQLGGVQGQIAELQTGAVQSHETLATLQQENTLMNLVATKFPQLIQFAPTIRRVADPAQQEAILAQAAALVGVQVAQGAQALTAATFQGTTPGQSPPAGGNVPVKKERGDLAMELLSLRPGTPEYTKAKREWDELTKDDPKKLNPGWTDVMESDWDRIKGNPEYLEAQPKQDTTQPSPFLPPAV